LSMNVTIGTPAYYSVRVDNTNFAGATWTSYTSSNITASLGSTQGWHEIWVGLKGPASGATVTLVCKNLKLDSLRPTIVITNPATSTVNVPMIQLYGYSSEDLDRISCDVSNALGVETNLDAGVTGRSYDTNTWEFSMNNFECLDVSLTNGPNTIIVHATDLAGNVTTTNFNFTVDYSGKTNPPVFSLTWPTNGTRISGAAFNVDGLVNDPTVTVSGLIVATNGTTNLLTGLVERNGKFWVENIPLNAGTNSLTLTVADVVGNTSVTNINVVQSSLVLAMDPVADKSQLWNRTINVTGTISDASQAVWVNGVKGHNNGDGTWSASNVPTTDGGTASFTITAYESTDRQPDGSYGN